MHPPKLPPSTANVRGSTVRFAPCFLFGDLCWNATAARSVSCSPSAAPKSRAALKPSPWAPEMHASPSRLSEAVSLWPRSLTHEEAFFKGCPGTFVVTSQQRSPPQVVQGEVEGRFVAVPRNIATASSFSAAARS